MTSGRVVALVGVVLVLAGGCEKTDHGNIDRWINTEKGPGKLKEAVRDGSIDPDLSAHAAQNLIKIDQDADVRAALEGMSPDRRTAVAAKLAPRLWELARIEGEMKIPTPLQISAKDFLFDLRKYADGETRNQIDGYLIDWYAGGYYEGRSTAGRNVGAVVIRTLGPRTGERLMSAANAVVSMQKGGQPAKIGDELLLALAVSGHPPAVAYVLDIFHMDRGDPELPGRAIGALYVAYAEPGGRFDVVDPAGLVPNLDRIVEIAKDDTRSPQITNDAVGLIRATGTPHCLPPLLTMVSHPHRDPRYRWVGANNALKCGRTEAIVPVAEALPVKGEYEHEAMAGAMWEEIARMTPRDRVLTEARTLLGSGSWVARWIGAETLAKLMSKEDVGRLRALAGDRAKLDGYWGDQSETPKKERKPELTLGRRVEELVKALETERP